MGKRRLKFGMNENKGWRLLKVTRKSRMAIEPPDDANNFRNKFRTSFTLEWMHQWLNVFIESSCCLKILNNTQCFRSNLIFPLNNLPVCPKRYTTFFENIKIFNKTSIFTIVQCWWVFQRIQNILKTTFCSVQPVANWSLNWNDPFSFRCSRQHM